MNKATNRRKTAAELKKQQHQVFTPTQTTNMNESSVLTHHLWLTLHAAKLQLLLQSLLSRTKQIGSHQDRKENTGWVQQGEVERGGAAREKAAVVRIFFQWNQRVARSKQNKSFTNYLSQTLCVCVCPPLSLSLLRLIHNSVLDSYLVGAIGFCVAFLGLQWKRVHEQCAICNWIVQQNFTERSERKKESTRKRMIPQQQRKICKLCFYESGLRERERERERIKKQLKSQKNALLYSLLLLLTAAWLHNWLMMSLMMSS